MIKMEDETIIDNSTGNIRVENVYELALIISEEFESFKERFDLAEINTLITYVVQILVHLEEVVLQRDNYLKLIDKLYQQIEELKKENYERSKQQMKYFTDIEDIDETWRKENVQLSQYVQLLKKENLRLSSSIKSNEKFYHSLADLKFDNNSEKSDNDDEDVRQSNIIKQNEIDKLNNRLNRMSKEIMIKNEEIDSLKALNNDIMKENTNLHDLMKILRNAQKVNTKLNHNDGNKKDSTINNDLNYKQLKARINELELELKTFKDIVANDNEHDLINKDINAIDSTDDIVAEVVADEVDEDFAHVQGPIPKEPDEKLYYRSGTSNHSSRIWSFFKFFKR